MKRVAWAVSFLLLLSFAVTDQIYTYVDSQGRIVVTNAPSRKKNRKKKKEKIYFQTRSSRLYEDIIREKALKYGIDPKLIKALITVESGFNPWAVSRKGAKGLMQLMPETARRYGVKNIFDPEENIEAGVRHLRELIDRFGDLRLAVAAYNAGATAVEKYRGIPPYKETRSFVRTVFSLYKRKSRTVIYRYRNARGVIVLSNSPPLPGEAVGKVEIIR